MGKDISGGGMDTKVVNRGFRRVQSLAGYSSEFERIFVRDLSPAELRQRRGPGHGGVVTDRLLNQMDWEPTYINALTAWTPAAIRTPDTLPDRPRMPGSALCRRWASSNRAR